MEILITIFVLSIGLLGVVALIPLGKLSMADTEKSDRTGACGRAALREVRIRRMLDASTWTAAPALANPVIIDPMGITSGLAVTLGALDRINLNWCPTVADAERAFRWQDDVIFVRPEEIASTTAPPPGTRPQSMDVDGNGIPDNGGAFSWFLMVTPLNSDANAGVAWVNRRTFNVSVVVCDKRVLAAGGEAVTPAGQVTIDSGPIGYGGVSISVTGEWPTDWTLRNGNWILLYAVQGGNIVEAHWYRVVHAGYDGTDTRISLVGPDWHGGDAAPRTFTAISVEGVTGVYTTTVQVN